MPRPGPPPERSFQRPRPIRPGDTGATRSLSKTPGSPEPPPFRNRRGRRRQPGLITCPLFQMNLARLKDAALEKTLLAFLRPKLQRYGDVYSLTLDTSAKIVTAEIRLHGDPESITVSQARYRVEQKGPDTFLIIHDVKISKE